MKRIYYPEKEGKMVYPRYNLKENISWHNVFTYPMGLIYGILTFEWLRPKCKFMIWRLRPWKIWMPLVYAKDYYEEK